jgi:photosystem II PsbY protein
MAMATAVASTSVTSLKRSTVFGAGVQGLRVANQKVSGVKLGAVPITSAKLSASSDGLANQVALGANTIAGAMFAAMATSESAMASQQIMALAEGDNRVVALLIPLVPAIGWVLFNILKPALNQVDKMRSAKSLVAGAGLGALATLVAAPHADAVQEIAQVADSDARGLIIIGLLLPAIGWVLFNILRPALNQIEKMQSGNTVKTSKRSVIGALGLGGASMLLAPHADAAQEIATLADSDSRGLIIIGLLLPAIGWVLFNILRPALNQIEKMQGGNSGSSGLKKSRGIIGVTGISAAATSLLAAPQADAQVQELAQLGADTRPLILLFILAPAIGWVLFNILKPALNQVNKMVEGNNINTGKGGKRK